MNVVCFVIRYDRVQESTSTYVLVHDLLVPLNSLVKEKEFSFLTMTRTQQSIVKIGDFPTNEES
jgi:hypothetical protein